MSVPKKSLSQVSSTVLASLHCTEMVHWKENYAFKCHFNSCRRCGKSVVVLEVALGHSSNNWSGMVTSKFISYLPSISIALTLEF